ncbi:MAG: ATP-grasp domain-containing protein [bacterium]
MFLTEFESKKLLHSGCIPIPEGVVVRAGDEIDWDALQYPLAVKAQVASGGRGKLGGIVRAENGRAARQATERLLNTHFSMQRTEAVLVEPWLSSERELYLSVTIDANSDGYAILYSPRGGVEVEAGPPPLCYGVGPPGRFRAHRLRELLAEAEQDSQLRERLIAMARDLLWLASKQDCLTVEINPLILTGANELIAADCKVILDESASFRSAWIAGALERQQAREEETVRRCLEARLMLVRLGGNVGLISGGAGMTMAAMDLIEEAGGSPACFLDCSANPTPDGYRLAFELLDADPQVKVILVSIFGGATNMARVGKTMCSLLEERNSDKPVVFRLAGTHEEQLEPIFRKVGRHNHPSLEEAVRNAVQLLGEAS